MTEENGQGRYLTVDEVATDLRLSKMTVYRLIDKGQLPAIRVGRSFRILREQYEAWLRKGSDE